MVDNTNKILIIFPTVCITVRLFLAYLGYYLINSKYLKYLLFLTTFIGISFLYQFIFNKRHIGAFGQKAWWHCLRLTHGILYLLFSLFAFYRFKYSYLFIILESFIGLIAHINHHYLRTN